MNDMIGTGFITSTTEVNVVGAILGKGLGFTLTETDGVPLD